MEEFKKSGFNSERQDNRSGFRGGPRPGMKPRKHNGMQNRSRDRQKGMVTAFVQGKGQNAALKWLMDTRTPVSIFLITGVKFEGLVSAFDAFTISITDVKHHQQMIYKDKISTVTVKKADAPSHGTNPKFRREMSSSADKGPAGGSHQNHQ